MSDPRKLKCYFRHGLLDIYLPRLRVLVGAHDLLQPDDVTVPYGVLEIHLADTSDVQEAFNECRDVKCRVDLALLKLNYPISFKDIKVQPICLRPTEFSNEPFHSITGWNIGLSGKHALLTATSINFCIFWSGFLCNCVASVCQVTDNEGDYLVYACGLYARRGLSLSPGLQSGRNSRSNFELRQSS